MEQVLEIGDRFYILAGADLLDAHTLVLKHGDTFAIFNAHGDIESIGRRSEGLFTEGMRHLSRLGLRLNGARPLLLGSRILRDNTRMTADLTNPDMEVAQAVVMPRGSLHLARTRYLWNNSLFERLALASYAEYAIDADVTITFGCDFADIFEVRGTERSQRGTCAEPEIDSESVAFVYEGLDGVRRSTIVRFDPPPASLSATAARFDHRLAPHERLNVRMTVECEVASMRGSESKIRRGGASGRRFAAAGHQGCAS